MFAVLILIVTLVGCYMWWKYEINQKYRSVNSIPGPRPLPVIGNALEFGFNPVEKLINIQRLSDTYGDVVKAWIGPKSLYVLTTDPKLMELILSSPKYITKSQDYDIFRPWLGNGLLISTGSFWQKRRKTLTPAFHFKILDNFVSVFNAEGNVLIERLKQQVNDKSFDIYPYITAYTLDVICETAMGTSVKAQSRIPNEYVLAVKDMCNVFIERVFSAWKQFDSLFKYSNDFKKQTDALKIIHGFTKSVIAQRRLKMLNQSQGQSSETKTDDEIGIKKKMVFLDILLSANIDGLPLTDEEIREEVDTFMFEGHDTTASAIAFIIYELSKNIPVQNKLLNEVKEIYGNDKNYCPTLKDLNDMKYMDAVIKEGLRLYPSVPFIARKLEEDVNYKNVTLCKGVRIFLYIYGMQRRGDLFPEPDKFNPDRFLENNLEKNVYSYVPFSAGPRNCIGQKFATYEMKTTLAKLVMNFEIQSAESNFNRILASEVILKSANGIHVKLKQR